MKAHHSNRILIIVAALALSALNCVSKYDIVRLKNDSYSQSQILSMVILLKNPEEPGRTVLSSNKRSLEIQFVKEIKNNAEIKNELTFSFTHAADDADMASKAFFSVDGKPIEIVLSGVNSTLQSRTSSRKSTSYQHTSGSAKPVETTTVRTRTFKVSKAILNLPQPLAESLNAGNSIQVRVYYGADTATYTLTEKDLAALKRYLSNTPDEVE